MAQKQLHIQISNLFKYFNTKFKKKIIVFFSSSYCNYFETVHTEVFYEGQKVQNVNNHVFRCLMNLSQKEKKKQVNEIE